jgi:hypothetical protein
MSTPLERFVSGSIVRRTRTAARPNFAMPCIVGYHTRFAERTRTYAELSEMLDDGFVTTDAVYQAALRLASQSPRPDSWKIGRRASAPTQVIRLTPPTPTAASVHGFSVGGVAFEATADGTPTLAEVCAALVAIVNDDADAIVASGVASAATQQVLDSTDMNGVIGAGLVSPARNFTFTFTSHADWDATTLVVEGRRNGRVVTENIAIPNGGNATVVGTKVFDMDEDSLAATTFTIPAQSGVGGALTIGVGGKFDDDGFVSITASGGVTYVDVTADVAGAHHRFSDFSTDMVVEDRTADPGLAADLTAIRAADAAWRLLHIADAQSSAQILAAAEWAETEFLVYVADTVDTVEATDDEEGVSRALADLGYMRTKTFHSRVNHGLHFAIGAVCHVLTADPGAGTIDYKSVTGITADDFSTSEINRLVGESTEPASSKCSTVYIEGMAAGTNEGTPIVWGGLVAGGEWLDIVIGLDWVRSDIQIAEFEFQLNAGRVPYTRAGIQALADVVEARLRVASRAPYNILDESSLVVTPKSFDATTPAERQTRYLNGVKWGGRVQGAIRALDVGGEVTA